MATFRRVRRSIGKNVRRSLEVILLAAGLIGGLAIVGSCASGASPEFGSRVFDVGAGVFVALVLVGAIFLFTTMSRDLRLMREQFTDDHTAGQTRRDDAAAKPPADVEV
jgi:hypothetical protein